MSAHSREVVKYLYTLESCPHVLLAHLDEIPVYVTEKSMRVDLAV